MKKINMGGGYSVLNKRAFTLIELLAVIVILAIIVLIAVPILINIIEDTNKSAVKRSAENYIDAVELYITRSELDNNKLKLKGNNKYNVTNSTLIEDKNYLPINELVEVKGSKPTGKEDYITLNNVGQVIEGKLTISGYIIEIKNGTITNVKKDKTIKVKELKLNITEQTMEKNSTFKIIPSFKPEDASNQEVTYESSNNDIVTVDELGNVKAINAGTAKITVTSKENSNIKAECNITVIVSATSLTLSPKEKQIRVGESVQLSGTIEPGDVTSNALTWSTSNAEIATVNENGLVTGISVGEINSNKLGVPASETNVEITATTVNGISDTITVTVTNKTIAGNIPQGNFELGDEYIVNVDGINKYHFYVLSTEGDKVNLISSGNMCQDGILATSTNRCTVLWMSKEDYSSSNYGDNGNNNKGPKTAMNYLYRVTKNWINIENIQMNYTDEGNNYGTITTSENTTIITNKSGITTASYTNLKSRIPKLSEIERTGCSSSAGSCPAWMVNGLNANTSYYPLGIKEDIVNIYGYWSLSSNSSSSYQATNVDYFGFVYDYFVGQIGSNYGIRPVIEVLKFDLQ